MRQLDGRLTDNTQPQERFVRNAEQCLPEQTATTAIAYKTHIKQQLGWSKHLSKWPTVKPSV